MAEAVNISVRRTLGRGHGIWRARVLFQQACESGESAGCYHLAQMLEIGRSMTKDEARAAKLYDDSCTKETIIAACVALAHMYEEGRGVTADAAKAATLMKKACAAGETSACGEKKQSAKVEVRPSGRGDSVSRPAPAAAPHVQLPPAKRGRNAIADSL